MKEQIKAAEKIQLSDKEIDNLSDAQLKTLVIRMLTEKIDYGHKIEDKVKAMISEIKKNVQGTNSEWKETRTQINIWNKRKKYILSRNIMNKQEFEKMRRCLETSGTTVNIPTYESQGCQKEKRKSKKLKAYLKK